MQNKKATIILFVVIFLVVVFGVIYAISPATLKNIANITKKAVVGEKPRVIEEELVIPETKEVNVAESRNVVQGPTEVPLVPKTEGEKVVVVKAVLTAKSSHNLAIIEAEKWSVGAKTVFVKSLGTVTLEGKSSQWQAVFSSSAKPGKGYEVIIQSDQIVSKKEIDSTAVGADLPENVKDSGEAVAALQDLPQFADATMSSINLYYNSDGKIWRYALATSKGTTSVSAQ